jgi:hypothetical protein
VPHKKIVDEQQVTEPLLCPKRRQQKNGHRVTTEKRPSCTLMGQMLATDVGVNAYGFFKRQVMQYDK